MAPLHESSQKHLCLSTGGGRLSPSTGGHLSPHTAATSHFGGPVRECHPWKTFEIKFLLSSALSAGKLTPVKVQNTTHFYSRLYCTHPARGNTKKRDTRHRNQDCDGTQDRGARKWDVPSKMGRVATLSMTCNVCTYPAQSCLCGPSWHKDIL